MLALFETSAGYAIFKLLDEKKLGKIDNLYKSFETPEDAGKIVKLKHFEKFSDTTEALAATTAAVEGKLSKSLENLLTKHVNKELQEQLLVSDAKLGSAIKEKFSLQCLSNSNVQELMRCIRSQLDSLISGLPKKEMTAMSLGLAHSLSRYKLKFSPDKVDTMIVQAVSLLDDLDKEVNNYIMKCREWYGWHFPELGKIITDNIAFTKTVRVIGTRENTVSSDLSDILPEEVEEKVKEAAEISMGTEISEADILNIMNLCDQILDITTYRTQLYDYLKTRMAVMAPNLTALVGELTGARLISHAGSLVNLSKHPASTIQILGAEKALFRALKTKKDTPKYGLIYHSVLVSQSSTKNKGKMARMLAAKIALCTRVDALGEDGNFSLGLEHREKLESRLRFLEEGNNRRISGSGKAKAILEKYHAKTVVLQYPDAADSTLPVIGKRKRSESETVEEETTIAEVEEAPSSSKRKKHKKAKKLEEEVETMEGKSELETEESPKRKKKKVKKESVDRSVAQVKMKAEDSLEEEVETVGGKSELEMEETPKKKKKKVKKESVDGSVAQEKIIAEDSPAKKKKKRKKLKQ